VHNARGVQRENRCRILACLRLSFHFTEPPHRAAEVKQQGVGEWSPILFLGKVTHRSNPGLQTTEATCPAPVAQWIEQAPSKRLAAGSSPAGGALFSALPPGGRFCWSGAVCRALWSRHAGASRPPGGVSGSPAGDGFVRSLAGVLPENFPKFRWGLSAVGTRRPPRPRPSRGGQIGIQVEGGSYVGSSLAP
jgi:hypothetical protein